MALQTLHNVNMHPEITTRRNSLTLFVTLLVAACGGPDSEPSNATVQALAVPAAVGGRSPNLAAGADGRLLLSWIEPAADGHALVYAELSDGRWSQAKEVASGDNWFVNWADFPSVVPLSSGLLAAHWLVSQPAGGYAYDVLFSISTDDGGNWTEPLRPHRDGTATEHGFVSIYPHAEGAGLVWLDGRNTAQAPISATAPNGMTLRAAVIGPDLTLRHEQVVDGLICDCCQTDVAVTAAGPVGVYRDRSAEEVRDIYVTRSVNDDWRAGQPIAHDQWNIAACPVNGPAISASGDALAVAWFTAAADTPVVRLAFSDDAGASFSTPVDIATGRVFGRVGIALLPGGAAAVSWLGKTSDQHAQLKIVAVSAEGTLGKPVVVGRGDTISGFTVPQLVLHDDRLVMAWTATVDDANLVRSARIALSALGATD